jgi:hypothetical protein
MTSMFRQPHTGSGILTDGRLTRRSLFRSASLMSTVMLSGCMPWGCAATPTAKQALLAAKAFIDALLLLDQVSKAFQGKVAEACSSTKRQFTKTGSISDQNIDLSKVAVEWEERWKAVVEQTAKLENQYSDIKKRSDEYWKVLQNVTDAIADDGIRKSESRKNEESKRKWDTAYEAAAVNISRAKTLRDKGSDMQRVILAAALRRQLEQQTSALDSIAKEAESLLRSLEGLTEQGRSLVNLGPPIKI